MEIVRISLNSDRFNERSTQSKSTPSSLSPCMLKSFIGGNFALLNLKLDAADKRFPASETYIMSAISLARSPRNAKIHKLPRIHPVGTPTLLRGLNTYKNAVLPWENHPRREVAISSSLEMPIKSCHMHPAPSNRIFAAGNTYQRLLCTQHHPIVSLSLELSTKGCHTHDCTTARIHEKQAKGTPFHLFTNPY